MKNILIIISLISLVACNQKQEGSPAENTSKKTDIVQVNPEQAKQAGLVIKPLEYIPVNRSIRVAGILDVPPQNLVSISAPVGGFVSSTDLLQGMKVKKGDILAVLEHPSYIQMQEDYLDTREKLSLADMEYERQKTLQAGQAGTGKTLQQSESARNQLLIQLKSLAAKLKMIGIDPEKLSSGNIQGKIMLRASVKGYVKSVNTNIGKYAAPEDVLFEIVDTEHMHVELSVFEKDISRIKAGQQITFTLPNQDGVVRSAHVYLVGRALNSDRTIHVHGHLDREEPDLIPGLFVNASIQIGLDSAWVVPEEALVNVDGKAAVFVERGDGKFGLIEVKAGERSGAGVPIEPTGNEDPRSLKVVMKGAHALLGILMNAGEN